MKKFIFTVLNGYVGLLFPLIVCVMLMEKLLHIIDPLVLFIENKLHVTRILGILGIFVISVLVLLLLGYLAGVLIKMPWVKKEIKRLEDRVLKKIPVYNTLKTLLDTQVKESDTKDFQPALLKDGDYFCLCYITSRSENYYTINICESASNGGEIRIVHKDSVKLLDLSFMEFTRKIRQYGIDSAQFAEKLKSSE